MQDIIELFILLYVLLAVLTATAFVAETALRYLDKRAQAKRIRYVNRRTSGL
jgi:predicted lysophospholipase L1 biosynthesis ABC-type transport system permease subunit